MGHLNLRASLSLLTLVAAHSASAQSGDWMFGPFEKPAGVNPIISPSAGSTFLSPMTDSVVRWEELATFNPAAVVRDGKVYVLYRAEDVTGKREIGFHTSRLGLAESSDGLRFTRRPAPVLFPDKDAQARYEWTGGVEDPRIVEAEDGSYVLTYTQWNRDIPHLAIATSKDLVHWTKHGPAFAAADNGKYLKTETKSGAILTRVAGNRLVATKVNGKYWMYFNVPDIMVATSDNLIDWTPLADSDGKVVKVLSPRPGYFDSWLVEAGPPAIMTERGILLVYNAGNSGQFGQAGLPQRVYTGGQALFDARNPIKLIARSDEPFIQPTEPYEKTGQYKDGTTFVEALIPFNGRWLLYYGTADSRVAVAVWNPKRAASTTAESVATAQEAWWRDGVCYEVFVRSFSDADGDGVGDLRGLISRLDYINDGNPASATSLGARCIWLMPIDKSVSYHGYDVTDYYHVDPHYGTDDDFRALVEAAHRRGIHVIVDFVPNHSSSENPWFQSALRDPSSPYRSWYRWSRTPPTQKGPWGQEIWHKSPVRDEYYYGLFWGGMPDLNYETPAVLDEMLEVTTHWLRDMHADGFRFDAVPYLVEDGEDLAHTRGTHDVLRRYGNSIRAVSPPSFTIGEMSDEAPQILATYYPDQLDAYFAFGVAFATIRSASSGDASAFIEAVREANATFPEGRWSPFLANHDHERVMTQLGDIAKTRVAASAMLMLPGMPFVYYGEEIGMVGAKPDETIRTPMQWSAERGAGFTAGEPWENPQSDWRTKNVAAQDPDRGSLLNHYRRLIHLRNDHRALGTGTLVMGTASNSAVAAFMRRSPTETAIVIANFGALPMEHVDVTIDSAAGAISTGRLVLIYGDPTNGCVSEASLGANRSMQGLRIAPHGLCVYRLARG
jgi:alpha-amylase